jgi:hypothetical protein
MNFALLSMCRLKIDHIFRNFFDKGPRYSVSRRASLFHFTQALVIKFHPGPRYSHRLLWSRNVSDSSVETEMGREILDDHENETLTDYVLLADLIKRTGNPC